MKYWFYSEGNILGPYAPVDLLSLPAFSQGSLVCSETSTGDTPGDWKAAEGVAEIAEAMSVGVGGVISSRAGGISGMYELETGRSSSVGAAYYETKNDQPYGYENLLNTIDSILGAKESETSVSGKPANDYELMDRFDIRLSKIQEELEAARWEKNLLLEKIRAKESEELKNRERIAELEGRLKGAIDKTDINEKELSQIQHLTELSAGAGTLKKIEELKKEDFTDGFRASPSPAARPGGESGILKSIPTSKGISPDRIVADGKEVKDDSALTSRKLRSLGRTPAPVTPISNEEHKGSATDSGYFPATANTAPKDVMPTLPRQAADVVYDFTAMTGQSAENEKIQAKSETAPQPIQPAQQPVVKQSAPQAHPQNSWQPQPSPVQPQYSWQPAALSSSPLDIPAFKPVPETVPGSGIPASKETDAADKAGVLPQKQKDDPIKNVQPTGKGRGKIAFISILIIFGAVAAGGLGYFFLGEGSSFSEFSLLNFAGGGKSKKASFSTQVEPKADKADDKTAAAGDVQAFPADQREQGEAQSASTAGSSTPDKPAFEAASNENTRKALETVKGYKLSGGRGTVASWFANSFLSNSSSGSNEEWSATILHGDIFVVQYRLLRPKQDPLIYQFEVDVAKNIIVRGINNNAIELLDFSSKATARAEFAPKPKARKAAPKAGKSRGIPILPLPDEPAKLVQEEDPTGFEAIAPAGNEKVKYIMAQESDEELF
ncbi:MAG: hypothetical protein WCK75_07700 [Elusimicrobiota bacterium]